MTDLTVFGSISKCVWVIWWEYINCIRKLCVSVIQSPITLYIHTESWYLDDLFSMLFLLLGTCHTIIYYTPYLHYRYTILLYSKKNIESNIRSISCPENETLFLLFFYFFLLLFFWIFGSWFVLLLVCACVLYSVHQWSYFHYW